MVLVLGFVGGLSADGMIGKRRGGVGVGVGVGMALTPPEDLEGSRYCWEEEQIRGV